MLRYKSFVFGQVDNYNVDLYQYQRKEIMENAGRGKGRGTGTGKFHDKLEHIGHFNSIGGCLHKMLQMEMAASTSDEDIKTVDILKMVSNKIEEFEKVLFAVKGKLVQEERKTDKEEEMNIEDLKVA